MRFDCFLYWLRSRRAKDASGFDLELERQYVTFPASDLRLPDRLLGFLAKRLHLHAPHEGCGKRTSHFGSQFHELARVRQADLGHRAGGAQIARPWLACGFEKAAFLHVAPAEIIAVKMRAFPARRGFHILNYYILSKKRWAGGWINYPNRPLDFKNMAWGGTPSRPMNRLQRLYAGDVFARLGVDADDVADLDELRALHFQPGIGDDLFGDAGGGVAADGGLGFHDLEVHGGGDFHVEGRAVVEGEFDLHAFLEVGRLVAEHLRLDGRLFEGLVVHEVIELTVGVEVGYVVEIQPHVLNGLPRVEGALDVRAGLQIARLDADVGVAAPGFVVAVIQHFVEVAVQFEGHPFAKFVYVNHACTFLEWVLMEQDVFLLHGFFAKNFRSRRV